MNRLALASLALVLAAGACSEAPRPPDPRLWTIFDLQPQSAEAGAAVAKDAGLPGGVPVDRVLAADGTTLVVADTVDGYAAAYVTTEVWAYYDRVWIQPMYVLVAGWQPDGQPTPWLTDGAVKPIFSVGPASGFYSPFWQTIYVDVSSDPNPAALTTVRGVLDSGDTLTPGPGRTVSLVPDGTVVDANGTPTTPEIPSVKAGMGWLDGAPISFLDFGPGMFTWDGSGVVAETPLYHFVFPAGDGNWVALDVPSVAAAGPLGSGATLPPTVDGHIRYASYWRLYTVEVPPTAAVFAPPNRTEAVRPGLLAELQASGFPQAAGYSMDVATDPSVPSYIGHIAVDPSCFAATPLDLEACHWLDTQEHIRRYVDPDAIQPTAITVTCPVITVDHQPIPPVAW